MSIIRSIKNACRGVLGICIAAFLLLSYMVGSVELTSLHTISHNETSADLHSTEHEADPCHIRIYHAATAKACDHPVHISEDTKCSLCDTQFHGAQLIFDVTGELTFYSHTFFLQPANLDAASGVTSLKQGRAPPIC